MITITIFKPNGDGYKTIENPIRYETDGPLLTATYADSNGVTTSIRTTLPFFFEQGENTNPVFRAEL
jgi:hypothetical protein